MARIKYYYDQDTLSYKKIKNQKPRIFELISGFLISITVAIALSTSGINLYEIFTPQQSEEITSHINQLDKISNELQGIKEFIDNQKKMLEEQSLVLTKLRSENNKLTQVIGMNKQKVDALFKIQDEKAVQKIWIDRLVGFLIGLASSFLVAILFRFLDTQQSVKNPNKEDEVYYKQSKPDYTK
ncbi:hypothetical protein [Maribacter flavus]|uniref:Uncharacterized protein n=1 Tax=Maribacter flavus TaxID=1658664 RepID=A0A5B2TVX3_9FLAO|nr:hypothetical protein [Maribacter flavus]KAA2218273.1 hypothetical protein F0361_01235 [Maribacter flavus]